MQVLTRFPVQHVIEAVSVAPKHELPLAAPELGIDQHGNLNGIPIVNVVGRELKVSLQFTRVGVHRDHGVGVKVIPLADASVPIGTRISRAPIDQVQVGIK